MVKGNKQNRYPLTLQSTMRKTPPMSGQSNEVLYLVKAPSLNVCFAAGRHSSLPHKSFLFNERGNFAQKVE